MCRRRNGTPRSAGAKAASRPPAPATSHLGGQVYVPALTLAQDRRLRDHHKPVVNSERSPSAHARAGAAGKAETTATPQRRSAPQRRPRTTAPPAAAWCRRQEAAGTGCGRGVPVCVTVWWLTLHIFPRLMGFLGRRTFNAETRKVLHKPGGLVNLKDPLYCYVKD